jgi:hypothetical protein
VVDFSIPKRMWQKAFGGLPELRNICVASAAPEFVAALQDGVLDEHGDDAAGRAQTLSRLLFKAIRNVAMKRWHVVDTAPWKDV